MISLLIPTINRPAFIKRLLNYYNDNNFEGSIFIGDSSNHSNLELTRKIIQKFDGKINISHNYYPDLNPLQASAKLLKQISSAYVAMVMDDDFLVPRSINNCIEFLNNNPDYNSATGIGIKIRVSDDQPHGIINSCKNYLRPYEEADSAAERYLSFLRKYEDIGFSVHRTKSFRKMLKDSDNSDIILFGSLFTASLSIILGKSKQLDCLYLVRQIQKKPYRTENERDTYIWLTQTQWRNNLIIFHDDLVRELMFQDNIDLENASKIIMQGFYMYLKYLLEFQIKRFNKTNQTYGSKLRSVNYQKSNVLNGLDRSIVTNNRIFRKLKAIYTTTNKQVRDHISLNSILSPSSPYYNDFSSIYQSVVGDLDKNS